MTTFKFTYLSSALIFTAMLLNGCASSTTDSNAKIEATNSAKVSTLDHSVDMNANLKKNGVVAISEESKPAGQDKLSEAIRQQNDEGINQATTELLTKNPKDVRALNALAVVYFKKGRFEAAEYLLNKAVQFDQQSSELYSNLGLIKLAQGEKREAIKFFRKGLELNNQDAVIGANLGSIYVGEKDYTKAELALEIPVKKGTKDAKVLNNYAVALTGAGKIAKASEVYEKLIRDNPGQRDIMLNYSIFLIDHKQKYREGLDLLNRLKFVGVPSESRNVIKDLESRAKAGLK